MPADARARSRSGWATRPGGSPPTERMSSYITALVAGPYHRIDGEYRDGDRVIPLGVYCRASLAEHLDADVIFEVTRQGFEFFERIFDCPYPFEKYDQLFVPEFNAGAMENAGCVTFLEDYVFRSRVPEVVLRAPGRDDPARDGAHVVRRPGDDDAGGTTCGSTSRSPSTPARSRRPRRPGGRSAWTTFANTEKTWAYRQDQLPSTHPIAADIHDLEDVEVNFDGITYAKGASVLKQLVAWVGPRRVPRRHPAATSAPSRGATRRSRDLLGRARGDLRPRPEGLVGRVAGDGRRQHAAPGVHGRRRRAVHVASPWCRSAPEQWPTLRSHRLAIGLYDRTDGGLVRRDRVELDVTGARTERARAGRGGPAGPGAGQRRRPDLRQDPAGRAVAGDADRVDRRLRGHPAALAVLVGGLGHDPRRRDVDAGLPHAGAPRRRPRDRQLGDAHPAAAGRDRGHPLHRPGPAGRDPTAAGRRPARPGPRRRGRQRRPAAAGPGVRLGRGDRPAPRGRPRPARRLGSTARPEHRHRPAVAPAAPAGRGRSGRRGRDRRASWTATTPRPGAGRPPPRWRPGRRRTAKAEALGPRWWTATSCPTRSRQRSSAASPRRASWTCCGPTSRRTSSR